jgi:hypothetical protein
MFILFLKSILWFRDYLDISDSVRMDARDQCFTPSFEIEGILQFHMALILSEQVKLHSFKKYLLSDPENCKSLAFIPVFPQHPLM